MRYLTTDEYISNITNLIKKQNRLVNKYFDIENEVKVAEIEHIEQVMQKYDTLNYYVANEIMKTLTNIDINDRYIFQYFDSDTENLKGAKYFKIIITNKVTNKSNFIIITYDMRDFIVKIKPPNSESDVELEIQSFPLEKLTKGKFRKIFFEYLIEIVTQDTMPKLRKKIILMKGNCII